ncbi:hypothetical protein [Aureibaculum luteum]|uniref:hypothetical protein n=1 Tax=Aureibaculum luteum TaxID=1548456 RepID=UPI001E612FA3|nr:hypothetical protein [Aureibaculum luteum]
MKDFQLHSNDDLTFQIRNSGVKSWKDLIDTVKRIKYGRTSKRSDLELVWTEQKGTCSSKHAFLKKVADLNKIPNVKLMLCMFKMNTVNTPSIGNALDGQPITYNPEAHCYLSIEEENIDITSSKSSFSKIKDDIIKEIEIVPEQVFQFKIDYHKDFLKKWILKEKCNLSFDQVWIIREKCIENMSK